MVVNYSVTPVPMRLFMLAVSIFVFTLSGSIAAQKHIQNVVISSGDNRSPYNDVSSYIAEQLNNTLKNTEFIVIESDGSNENIQNLYSRYADFAICQRNVLLDNVLNKKSGVKNLQVLLPLFREQLNIRVNSSQSLSIEEFGEKINDGRISCLGVTSRDGYSFQIFLKVAKLLNIDIRNLKIMEDNAFALHDQLGNGDIQAVVTFSYLDPDFESAGSRVYFDEKTIDFLLRFAPNLSKMSLGSTNSGKYTLGSWAFLVGLDPSIRAVEKGGESLVTKLLSSSGESNSFSWNDVIGESVSYFSRYDNHRLLKGLPVNNTLARHIQYNESFILKPQFIVIGVLLSLLLFWGYKKNKSLDLSAILFRHRHLMIAFPVVVIVYICMIEFLLLSEWNFYQDYGFKSQLVEFSKKDLHFWVVISNLTGNHGEIFPLSSNGKWMLSFSSYFFWLAALIVGGAELGVLRYNARRRKGLMQISYKNHMVVTGWSESTPKFIHETRLAFASAGEKSKKIVCIVEDPERIISENAEMQKLESKKLVQFVAGDARLEDSLRQANVYHARTIVLLAEDSTISADERTLLRALAISRLCRREAVASGEFDQTTQGDDEVTGDHHVDSLADRNYIVAELNEEKYSHELRNSDVNEIVVSALYGKSIITQCILNHGISKILNEVFTISDGNEIYVVDLKENQYEHLRWKTFDELLLPLREQGVQLLALKIVFTDQFGKEIVDEDIIKRLLAREKLVRQMILNPTDASEIARKTDENDQLIVFAHEASDLKNVLAKVKF